MLKTRSTPDRNLFNIKKNMCDHFCLCYSQQKHLLIVCDLSQLGSVFSLVSRQTKEMFYWKYQSVRFLNLDDSSSLFYGTCRFSNFIVTFSFIAISTHSFELHCYFEIFFCRNFRPLPFICIFRVFSTFKPFSFIDILRYLSTFRLLK